MEFQELLSFITVANQKSFTKAATKLGYSKSSITIHIKNLENELNVQLIERLGKHITLTNQGQIFYYDALNIMNSIDAAKNHLNRNEELNGTLVIGTIDSLCNTKLPNFLELFHQKHPHVKMVVITDTINGLINKLISNDIDLAYLYDNPITDLTFHNIHLQKSKTSFVASSQHPYSNLDKITINELKDTTLILTEKDASYRRKLDEELCHLSIKLEPVFTAQNTEIILKLLSKNIGISYLPAYVIQNCDQLVAMNSDYDVIMEEQILYHKDKTVTKEMEEMIAIIKQN